MTQNDLSAWFNTKTNLHCFIATATPEYQTIIANPSRYKLTEKEVVLAGFPRYDNLVSKNIAQSKKNSDYAYLAEQYCRTKYW